MTAAPLRYLSLFSGIGGFDLGFDRAGMVCAGQVEYDEKARSVLARHWPDVKRINDVREVKGDEFGTIDIVCGGFPCQDVSVAGRRAGLAGERSGLWYEFRRIIDAVKPGTVVIENVPGLLSSCGCSACVAVRRILRIHRYIRRKRKIDKPCPVCLAGERMLKSHRGRDFAIILQGLVELGYGVAWRVLDAQYFGVAQRRRRVFIVGSLGNGCAAEVLFEREGGGGDSPQGGRPGQDIARTIATGSNSNRSDWETETFVTTTFNGYTGGADDNDAQGGHLVAVPLRAEGHDASEDGTGRQNPVIAFQPRYYTRDNKTGGGPSDKADITNAHKAGDSAPHVVAFSAGNSGNSYGIGLSEDVSPPLRAGNSGTNQTPTVALTPWDHESKRIHHADGVSPTLAGSDGGGGQRLPNFQTQLGVRRLTPVECERLQGFPDGWTDGQSDSARYRQLGNAVAVSVVEWLARRIIEVAP